MQIRRLDRLLFICSLVLLAAVIVYRLIPKGSFTRIVDEVKGADIVFAHYWGDAFNAEWIREFEDANPGTRVRVTAMSYADARELAVKKMDGGESMSGAYDVIALDGSWVSTMRVNGGLHPLAEFDQSQQPRSEWAVPVVSFMDVLYYNKDLLKAAGFDRPPSNREEFTACAKALAANGVYALSFSLGDAEGVRRDIYPWLWAAGASLLDEQIQFEKSGAAGALDFLKSLKTGGFVPQSIFLATEAEQTELFTGGKSAALVAGINRLGELRGALGGRLGLTMIPGHAGFGKPGCAPRTWQLGIASGCSHPKEAWAFVSFLKGKAAAVAEKMTAVPGSGLALPSLENDGLYTRAWTVYEASDVFDGSNLSPAVNAMVREELLPLLEGTANGKETAAGIDKHIGVL